jgi:APA family basic amino acid/polyamine antiporter
MISIIVTIVIYILIAISAISLVGWHDLYLSEAPLAKAAEKASGTVGTFILSVIALFATSNTVLMMLVSGSRLIYGISNDRRSSLSSFFIQNTFKTKDSMAFYFSCHAYRNHDRYII